MTQVFDKTGRMTPVTLVEAGPATVTQIKTVEKDGYTAVQIGFGKAKRISKPMAGHVKNMGKFKYLGEFVTEGSPANKVGDKIDVSVFQEGDIVNVSGTSKSKGYAGCMKRYR